MRSQQIPDGAAVAAAFGLGHPVSAPTFAARGELGVVYRLATARGVWAVKQLPADIDGAALHRSAAFEDAVADAEVPLPRAVRTATGAIAAVLPGSTGEPVTVRVSEWVDLAPHRAVHPVDAAALLGRIHGVAHRPWGAPDPWFAEPVGRARWDELRAAAVDAGAPWLPAFEVMVREVAAADELIGAAPAEPAVTCHCDYNRDNVLITTAGGHVVIDWDNAGTAARGQELATALLEFPCGDRDTARGFRAAYVAGGGVDAPLEAGHFSMALAFQAHLLEFFAHRWLSSPAGSDDRARSAWRLDNMARELWTRARIEELVAWLR